MIETSNIEPNYNKLKLEITMPLNYYNLILKKRKNKNENVPLFLSVTDKADTAPYLDFYN